MNIPADFLGSDGWSEQDKRGVHGAGVIPADLSDLSSTWRVSGACSGSRDRCATRARP